ncbi:MAG: radical SAM protein [Candidatus Nanoarchaeia archaeon]|jgi:MoaA/NifB/PqqE/SkfB family radical SAM enzyme
MKAYVIPIENACNARCPFCITKYRQMKCKSPMSPLFLENTLKLMDISKIEITGGGEPTLNSFIGEIIKVCAEKAETQMYTNGSFGFFPEINLLSTLCISRHHYEGKENKRLMGISYNLAELCKNVKCDIKLSLLLLKSGISTKKMLEKYLEWAKATGIKKVVVRQLLKHNNKDYMKIYEKEFVPTEGLKLDWPVIKDNHGNKVYSYEGVEVEIETRECSCESGNPVIHADGFVAGGWDK